MYLERFLSSKNLFYIPTYMGVDRKISNLRAKTVECVSRDQVAYQGPATAASTEGLFHQLTVKLA